MKCTSSFIFCYKWYKTSIKFKFIVIIPTFALNVGDNVRFSKKLYYSAGDGICRRVTGGFESMTPRPPPLPLIIHPHYRL